MINYMKLVKDIMIFKKPKELEEFILKETEKEKVELEKKEEDKEIKKRGNKTNKRYTSKKRSNDDRNGLDNIERIKKYIASL